jgi:hypothetical protein
VIVRREQRARASAPTGVLPPVLSDIRGENRAAMMPSRTRPRTQNRANRINAERRHNRLSRKAAQSTKATAPDTPFTPTDPGEPPPL